MVAYKVGYCRSSAKFGSFARYVSIHAKKFKLPHINKLHIDEDSELLRKNDEKVYIIERGNRRKLGRLKEKKGYHLDENYFTLCQEAHKSSLNFSDVFHFYIPLLKKGSFIMRNYVIFGSYE